MPLASARFPAQSFVFPKRPRPFLTRQHINRASSFREKTRSISWELYCLTLLKSIWKVPEINRGILASQTGLALKAPLQAAATRALVRGIDPLVVFRGLLAPEAFPTLGPGRAGCSSGCADDGGE